MATNNFYNKNASHVYSIFLEEEYEWDRLIEDLVYKFEKKFKSDFIELDEWDNNRNFEGKIIGKIDKQVGDERIIISIIVRIGYYDGANLDWDAEFYVIENDYEEIYDYECINLRDFPKIESEFNKLITKVEKIYKEISTPLNKVGQFSNGEAVYKKA